MCERASEAVEIVVQKPKPTEVNSVAENGRPPPNLLRWRHVSALRGEPINQNQHSAKL